MSVSGTTLVLNALDKLRKIGGLRTLVGSALSEPPDPARALTVQDEEAVFPAL